jgi:adenylate kinase family enzyme
MGASGSGTTALATALAAKHGHRHLDSDDFFWMPTNPPYQQKRPRAERLTLLEKALSESSSWVLSGSLCGWGDTLIAQFQLVVFLLVPRALRLARLREREAKRYGEEAIAPGGWRYEECRRFLDWAAQYDTGGRDMRSRALHEEWLRALPCPVLRLEGAMPLCDMLATVEAARPGR